MHRNPRRLRLASCQTSSQLELCHTAIEVVVGLISNLFLSVHYMCGRPGIGAATQQQLTTPHNARSMVPTAPPTKALLLLPCLCSSRHHSIPFVLARMRGVDPRVDRLMDSMASLMGADPPSQHKSDKQPATKQLLRSLKVTSYKRPDDVEAAAEGGCWGRGASMQGCWVVAAAGAAGALPAGIHTEGMWLCLQQLCSTA